MITRRAVILSVRVLLLAALAGAALDLPLPLPAPPVLRCYVLDLSGSLFWGRITRPGDILLALEEDAARGPAGDRFALVGFAGTPALLFPPGPRQRFLEFLDRDLRARLSRDDESVSGSPVLDPGRTVIEDALDLALSTGRGEAPLRVVLFSDGIETSGDARRAAARLRRDGVPLAVVPLGPYRPPDVRIVAARAPDRVPPGSAFDVEVDLAATVATTVAVEVRRSGATIARRETSILPDTGLRVAFPGLSPASDDDALEIRVVPLREEEDLCGSNNAVSLQVIRAPPEARRVLYVGPPAPRVIESRLSGDPRYRVTRRVGNETAPFDLVVLDDTPWDAVPLPVRSALASWVTDAGRGLLVSGGPQSLALGGYAGQAAIEPLLPVWAGPDERLGLALVLDRSSSMGMTADGRRVKIDAARDALRRVLPLLRADDRLALVAFNETVDVLRPALPPPEASAFNAALRGLEPRLGTLLVPPLRKALELLASPPAPAPGSEASGLGLRHILLVTDGETVEPPALLAGVGQSLREAGVTLTVIVTGRTPAREALDALLPDPASGRRIDLDAWDRLEAWIEEDIRRAKDLVLRGPVEVVPGEKSPLCDGLPVPPPLAAANRTTLRPDASPLFRGPHGAPLLALRRTGVGRTAVLATSLDDPAWGGAWGAWQPHAAALIDRLATFLTGADGPATLDAEPERDRLCIRVTIRGGVDVPSTAGAVVHRPDGTMEIVPLAQVAARRFEGRATLDRPGRYTIRAESHPDLPQGRGPLLLGTAFYDVPYPAEWNRLGRDRKALEAVATAAGGRLADNPSRLESERPGGLRLQPATATWILAALALLAADLLVVTFWPGDRGGRR